MIGSAALTSLLQQIGSEPILRLGVALLRWAVANALGITTMQVEELAMMAACSLHTLRMASKRSMRFINPACRQLAGGCAGA